MEVLIERLSHDGRGIASVNGKTTFVANALPGETVLLRYLKRSRRYDEAIADQVVQTPSQQRTLPGCEHFLLCGGCNLQHLKHEEQILYKQTILREHFQHFGQLMPQEWLTPIQAHPWTYRRKARLGVRYVEKKQKLLMGFREKNSRFLADLNTCEIIHPRVKQLYASLKQLISGLSAYNHIAQIEIAGGDDDQCALVIRHLVELTPADQEPLICFAKENKIDIYLQPGGPDSLIKLWPQDAHYRLSYTLKDFDLIYYFHPLDFVQVNAALNQKLVSLVMDLMAINKDETVLDLFCGLGNFTLPLAKSAKYVVGVEGAEEMVQRGYENAQINHLDNADFYAFDLFKTPQGEPWLAHSYDKMLIDPPRSGAEEVVQNMALYHFPKRIVYVSCNPATLARDAGTLVHQHEYTLSKAGVLDMFPHTAHVESIAVFDKP